LPRIQTIVLISVCRLKNAKFPALEAMSMTITEKLQLAGLAVGMTASIVWIAFLGFALSQAVAWLL
jgi:hypothetical protein